MIFPPLLTFLGQSCSTNSRHHDSVERSMEGETIASLLHGYLVSENVFWWSEYNCLNAKAIKSLVIIMCLQLTSSMKLPKFLVEQFLNCVLDCGNLTGELLWLACRHTGWDNRPRDITGSTKGSFGWQKDIRHILEGIVGMKTRKKGKRTFSSQRRGRWSNISRGSVSAVKMMNSAMPRLSVFVAVEKNWRAT